MKRVVIALIMLLAIAGISLYSLKKVESVYHDLNNHIDLVILAMDENNQQSLDEAVERLCLFWKEEESKLIHILRHAQIDEITKSISRLTALAHHREDAHLLAELDSIRWQIEHIWDSEPPTWQNLF